MYPRTNYEMTQADLDKIFEAIKPVPMIALHLGARRSQQERANDAWRELGERMGFDYMTVQPRSGGDRFFSAIPSETTEHKKQRLLDEAIAENNTALVKKQNEIETLTKEIREINAKIVVLQDNDAAT